MGGCGGTIEVESFTELFRGFKGRSNEPPFFIYGVLILVMTFLTPESYFFSFQAGIGQGFILCSTIARSL